VFSEALFSVLVRKQHHCDIDNQEANCIPDWQPGDPSTPGYPSLPGSVRIVPEDMEWLPRIPSLPISYEDAAPLLEALNGQGPSATSMGKSWEGGGLGYRGVEYNVGPSAPEVLLRVVNDQAYEFTTIHNLIAVVNGTEEDEVVLIGNHHDAWTLGGAADPHSGSAALNEIVRSFGKALGKGWKPRRTLVFARWDAEEYAMIGSTEWVEEHLPWLSDTGVAYINVDPGVTGSKFYASAAPLIHELLRRSTESVLSPNQTIPGQTLADLWESGIETLGGGSDFGAFQHHAGIVSVDMNFQFSEDAPPFHYHSQYDSITYMERIIDPDFLYHKALAQLWGLMTAELVDAPILPFNVTDYATALEAYIDDVKKGSKQSHSTAIREHRFDNLTSAADRFLDTAITFDREALALSQTICRKKGWFVRWRPWQENHLKSKAKRVNGKLRALERQFLYEGGLDDRPWFKHTIFAPGYWEGYSGVTLPGLRETIASDDEEGVSRWEKIITKALHQASDLLEQ
jgi:N-acetylated-alpha-linked acidic dipeptidase